MLNGARIVCITGMHCSGTSAVARILNLLGVDLGPPEVGAPARRSNTRGLWEHPALTRLGERILRTLGGSWDNPPELRPDWHTSQELDPHRDAAMAILQPTFGDSPLWGWKDPRSSLLGPFWEDLLGPLHYVICVRHPEDVAASLGKRDGMERERALALWSSYTNAVLTATENRPRICTCYEDLWRGAEPSRRLAAFLGRAGASEESAFREALTEWLDESMWHNRAGSGAEGAASDLPPDVAELYRDLRSLTT